MRKGSGRRVGSLATGRNDHMTASGTKPTSKSVRRMSAVRGKPDLTQTCLDGRV